MNKEIPETNAGPRTRETCATITEDFMNITHGDPLLRATHPDRPRKIAILIVAIVGFALVIGVLFRGFHGRQILRDANSLVLPTTPAVSPAKVPTTPQPPTR